MKRSLDISKVPVVNPERSMSSKLAVNVEDSQATDDPQNRCTFTDNATPSEITVVGEKCVDHDVAMHKVEEKKTPESRKAEPFNYDDIMELHIGQLGKFQLRSFLWLCLPALFPGLIVMSYSFTGGVPDYR